jgi:hypothetical protein
LKNEEEKKVKEDKAREISKRKEAVRGLSSLCEERAAGTRYDRFFFEEFTKKIKETAAIEEIIERLKAADAGHFVQEIEKIVSEHTN